MIKLMNRRSVRRLLIAVAALVLISVPVVAQIQFSDVPDDNPHKRDIDYVAGERWFLGHVDGSYKPDQNITPAQMTTVLTRAFDEGITRAEFASFMVAGNYWRQKVKDPAGFTQLRLRSHTAMFIVLKPDEIDELGEGIFYIEPGRYRISRNLGGEGWGKVPCRWMRLSHIPSGGQGFDTIAGTEAALAGYFQGEKTTEAHIIEIEITDFAFMADC